MEKKARSARPAPKARAKSEYYCLWVKRNYEDMWRAVSKHDTREAAQEELEKRRGYTGVFNYDNAELRVMSRTEARKEYGKEWDYKPIGGGRKPAPVRGEIDDEA